MATSALPTPDIGAPRLGWARLLALVPFAVVLATAVVELGLADRKFGLFTGGFGVSRTVDTLAERALFAGGYGAAMALLGVAGWWLAHRLTRGRPGWARAAPIRKAGRRSVHSRFQPHSHQRRAGVFDRPDGL